MSIREWDKNFEGIKVKQIEYSTDEVVAIHESMAKAARITGIGEKVISNSCYNKPKKKGKKAYSGIARDGKEYYFRIDMSKGK